MKFGVLIERASENYAAYVPDLPGCVTTGASQAEVELNIRDVIRLHLNGLREDGLVIPDSVTTCAYVGL